MLRRLIGFPDWLHTQWISRPWVDFVANSLVLAVHGVLVRTHQVPSLLQGTPVTSRPALYGAAAIVLSLTGTLGSVSVAQYLQARGVRARFLKERHSATLGASWRLIFGSTIVGSLLFLTAYRLDLVPPAPQGTPPNVGGSAGEWVFEAGALIAVAAVLRLFGLFGQVIDLVVRDDTDPIAPVVEINSSVFERPTSGVR